MDYGHLKGIEVTNYNMQVCQKKARGQVNTPNG